MTWIKTISFSEGDAKLREAFEPRGAAVVNTEPSAPGAAGGAL